MSTKHTPGPWVFGTYIKMNEQGDIPTQIHAGGMPNGRLIAELNFNVNDQELSCDKVTANAKLIAAAPDMLEAIQYAITALADDGGMIETGALIAMADKVRKRLTRASKKATY